MTEGPRRRFSSKQTDSRSSGRQRQFERGEGARTRILGLAATAQIFARVITNDAIASCDCHKEVGLSPRIVRYEATFQLRCDGQNLVQPTTGSRRLEPSERQRAAAQFDGSLVAQKTLMVKTANNEPARHI